MFDTQFYNRALIRMFKLAEQDISQFVTDILKCRVLQPDQQNSNVTVRSVAIDSKKCYPKSLFNNNSSSFEQTLLDSLREISQIPISDPDYKGSNFLLFVPNQTTHYQFTIVCKDQRYIQGEEQQIDILVFICNHKFKQSFLIQFEENIRQSTKQLQIKNKQLEMKNFTMANQIIRHQQYIKEIKDASYGIIEKQSNQETIRRVDQIQKYLQIMYYLNQALQESIFINCPIGVDPQLTEVNLDQLIRNISKLFSYDLPKKQNIIDCKAYKTEDEVIINDERKLKYIFTYILNYINESSKQNTIMVLISSFNDKVVKLTFQNSNFLPEFDQSKFTPRSMDEKDVDQSYDYDKYNTYQELVQISEILGQVGPEKKIEIEKQTNNISIKLYRKLEKSNSQIQYPKIKSGLKKKLTRPKEIILGYRENLDQLMKHQIATNININNPTITVNNQTSDIQRSLSDIDVRIEDTSKMRTPKPENNNPEKNITDQHCYFHKPQSKTINDQEELDIRSYSSPSQNCINQQQRKGSRYENKINFEYQLDMAQNSQKQLNDLIKGDINILLVGNNQYISQSFPKLLQEIEKIKKIDVAQNKQQIFEQLDKNFTTATQQCDYYKFIFLDNDIPDEDIYEITKSIKLKILGNQFTAKYTKLIMLLQKNDITQQKRSATDVGADSYQLKPMTLSNLIKTCKQFLA